MWNTIKNERGVTLVELLAVIMLSAIIMTFVGSLFVKATTSYERTSGEAMLRDEADLMMAKMSRDLFTLKASDIAKLETCTPGATPPCTNGVWLLLKDQKKIGFSNNSVLTRDGHYTLANDNVQLQVNYKICPTNDLTKCNVPSTTPSESYTIKFTLTHTKKNKQTSFTNEIPIVYDIK